MRNLFIVLAKVVGLLQIPILIGYLDQMILYFFVSTNYAVSVINCCFHAAFTWLLLFRSTWIADRLRIQDGEMPTPPAHSLLNIGLKLMGIYILVHAIPEFVWYLMMPFYQDPQIVTQIWIRIVPILLKIGLGLFLVFKTNRVIELITRDSKPKEAPVA
jgi:hypothetical protein